jgi:hypothetical protein
MSTSRVVCTTIQGSRTALDAMSKALVVALAGAETSIFLKGISVTWIMLNFGELNHNAML